MMFALPTTRPTMMWLKNRVLNLERRKCSHNNLSTISVKRRNGFTSLWRLVWYVTMWMKIVWIIQNGRPIFWCLTYPLYYFRPIMMCLLNLEWRKSPHNLSTISLIDPWKRRNIMDSFNTTLWRLVWYVCEECGTLGLKRCMNYLKDKKWPSPFLNGHSKYYPRVKWSALSIGM